MSTAMPAIDRICARADIRLLCRCCCMAIAFGLAGGSLVWAEPCTPPESMRARLQNKPAADAYTDLGVWFAEREKYACAVDAFATSLQMEPKQKDVAHVAFMFGVSLYFSGDTKEGISSLQEAERLGYRDIKIHLILGSALDSSDLTADAESEWRAALALDPECTSALDALSSDLVSDKDFTGTIALLEDPRLLPQRTEQQSLNLGLAYTEMERLDEATRVLQDGLNTTPDSHPLEDELADVVAESEQMK